MKKRSDVTHKLDARHSSLDPCLPPGPVSSPAIKHKRMTLDAVKKNCLDNGHLMMRARRRQSDSHTHRHIFPVGARERERGGLGEVVDAAPPVVGFAFLRHNVQMNGSDS